jgi:hypothetical protein
MNSDRVIADAIKSAQRLLWHANDLPDAMKVMRLRTLVRSPTIQSAMQRCSDTLLAFTLRAVELVIADQSRTDREMLRRLCDILNNPHLIQAVGPQTPHLDRPGSQLGQYPGTVGHEDTDSKKPRYCPQVMARR